MSSAGRSNCRSAGCEASVTREDSGEVSAGSGTTGSASTSGTGGTTGSVGGAAVAGTQLFTRLAGLWSGQAGETPLGSFPLVNMEFRGVDGQWLFGRVDLDAQNSLRYGLSVEDLEGTPTLVYRNGGYFQGDLRDLTTQLADFDDDAGTYHFCAADPTCLYVNGICIPERGGCGFVDALFTFTAPGQLVFNAHVNGQEHEIWTASRKSTDALPSPFPSDPTPVSADGGWPLMPQLSVTVSWTTPLANATNAWVILSDTPCGTTFSCTPSRTLLTAADAGATSATLLFDQLHPGTYYANALLDVADDFELTLTPQPGDLVAIPEDQSIPISAVGLTSANLAVNFALP